MPNISSIPSSYRGRTRSETRARQAAQSTGKKPQGVTKPSAAPKRNVRRNDAAVASTGAAAAAKQSTRSSVRTAAAEPSAATVQKTRSSGATAAVAEPSAATKQSTRNKAAGAPTTAAALTKPTGPLAGKVALVTGASRGIGKAIAERFAHDGAFVAVHYGSNATAATSTVAGIRAAGGQAFAVQSDFSNPEQGIAALYQTLDAELIKRNGSRMFDIVVNNAAMDTHKPIEEMTHEAFDKLLKVNVQAPFFVTQGAIPRWHDGGRLINISSGASRVAYPHSSAYALTKGAINNLSLSMAKQLGPRGITSNTLSPGVTLTEMLAAGMPVEMRDYLAANTALGRLGEPKDIADVAAFLASEDSHWVTAQYIEASGGIHI